MSVNISGLEKYLNSTGQVTLNFCLPGTLPRLPKFSNSLIILEPKNGSQATGMYIWHWQSKLLTYKIVDPCTTDSWPIFCRQLMVNVLAKRRPLYRPRYLLIVGRYSMSTITRPISWLIHRLICWSTEMSVDISGLEKYLNSTGQVTLNFCLPGTLPRLPKFSNSLIILEPKNGSQTTGVF